MGKKIAIILFVFVGFYMGAHFYIRWKNTVTDNVTKLGKLIPCEPNDVVSFRFGSAEPDLQEVLRVDQKKPGEPAAIQLENSEWKMSGNPMKEADQLITTAIVSGACEIYDPVPTKEEEYSGINGQKRRLLVKFSKNQKNEEWDLEFLSSPVSRDMYLRAKDPDGEVRFYKTQTKLFSLISHSPKELENLRFMRMQADNIIKVTVNSGGREEFTLERNGEGWDILQKGTKSGAGSEEAIKFVNRFTTLRALSASYDQLNPALCDSKNAKISVIMEGISGRKEILTFDYDKKSSISACNSEREAVFSIHKDFLPYLNTPVKSLLAK